MEIALIITICFVGICTGAWDYDTNGPSTWPNDYPNCNGRSQSPIDIVTSTVETDYSLGLVDRNIFFKRPTSMTISNDGHGLKFTVTGGTYEINDANLLPFTAVLEQYHFHWGSASDSGGAEHTVDGKQYFGELHAVHFNKKYGDISTAIDKPDGLAVFGWFIDIGYPQDNLDFGNFLTIAQEGAKYSGNTSSVPIVFSLETLLPPGLDVYYRYSGSLTTPTCDESVTWTVFSEPILIKESQATILADMFYADNTGTAQLNNNFRPVLPLNGRNVTKPPALVPETDDIRPSVVAGIIAIACIILFSFIKKLKGQLIKTTYEK